MLEVKDKKDTRAASVNPLVYIVLCLIVEDVEDGGCGFSSNF